jgi:thioredoxin 1
MSETHVLTIDDQNFESEVLGASVPFLLDFTATWCAPCKTIAPILETLAAESLGRYRIGKIDIDSSPATAIRLSVRGAPTLVVFRGAGSKSTLLALIGT